MNKPTNLQLHFYTLVLGTALSLSGVGAAAEGKRMFKRIDSNGDGVITLDEFQLPRHREREVDLNDDGQITRAEMTEHASARSEEMLERATEHFTAMDLNGDDVVTADEARTAMFNRLDKDQDGVLTPEEMKRPKHRPGKRKE